MRPKTEFEKWAVSANEKVPQLTDYQTKVIMSKTYEPLYYCNHKPFAYFALRNTFQGVQLERIFRVNIDKKGHALDIQERSRLFFTATDHAYISRNTLMNAWSSDSYSYNSTMNLHKMDSRAFVFTPYYLNVRFADWVKRMGWRSEYCNDIEFVDVVMQAVDNPHVETLIHAGETLWLQLGSDVIDSFWDSIRISMRNGYHPSDLSMWHDMMVKLSYLEKDLRNPHFVCPADLIASHDHWIRLANNLEKKRRKQQMIARIKEDEQGYSDSKGKYFGILIPGNGFLAHVLGSVQEFYDEGESMHHCVFANSYYKKPQSLIFSVRNDSNDRIATVEYDIKHKKVLQCRGVSNSVPELHDNIIQAFNKHKSLIKQQRNGKRTN